MKTILFNDLHAALLLCTAVVMDGTVTYPEVFEYEEIEDDIFMNVDDGHGLTESFAMVANANASFVDNVLILHNTKGEKTEFVLLKPMDL